MEVGRPAAHFLHIGKTGGTAIKEALTPLEDRSRYALIIHDRSAAPTDIPLGDFFFSVRDPSRGSSAASTAASGAAGRATDRLHRSVGDHIPGTDRPG